MAKYIPRTCPRCRDYFGVVVEQWSAGKGEHHINGFCATCGYRLMGWRVITGRKKSSDVVYGRIPKVFS